LQEREGTKGCGERKEGGIQKKKGEEWNPHSLETNRADAYN